MSSVEPGRGGHGAVICVPEGREWTIHISGRGGPGARPDPRAKQSAHQIANKPVGA